MPHTLPPNNVCGNRTSKSRPHLNNMIRLLDLPPEVKDLVVEGRITAGHARALLAVTDPVSVARQIAETGLSVRNVEAIAQTDPGSGSEPRSRRSSVKGRGHPRG